MLCTARQISWSVYLDNEYSQSESESESEIYILTFSWLQKRELLTASPPPVGTLISAACALPFRGRACGAKGETDSKPPEEPRRGVQLNLLDVRSVSLVTQCGLFRDHKVLQLGADQPAGRPVSVPGDPVWPEPSSRGLTAGGRSTCRTPGQWTQSRLAAHKVLQRGPATDLKIS